MHFLVSIEIVTFCWYLMITLRGFVIYIANLFLQNIAKDSLRLLTPWKSELNWKVD